MLRWQHWNMSLFDVMTNIITLLMFHPVKFVFWGGKWCCNVDAATVCSRLMKRHETGPDTDYGKKKKKRKRQNKHVNRGKAAVLAPASTSGERSSSQIINDTLPSRNYAQTQRGRKQNIHTSMTKRIHAADGICCTCDVVDSSQRAKMHREAESDGAARVWAKHLLLQNTSRLPRRRRVITLRGTFWLQTFRSEVWGVITHDCVELFESSFFFLLLQALGLLLVICDCNPRRLKKLSKEYNFGRE